MRQERRAIRPRAARQKRQRHQNRDRAQSHPLHYRYDRLPEGVPVHTESLIRFRKKPIALSPTQFRYKSNRTFSLQFASNSL